MSPFRRRPSPSRLLPAGLALCVAAALPTAGCGGAETTVPPVEDSRIVVGDWTTPLADFIQPQPGAHVWRWRPLGAGEGTGGPARLDIDGTRWTWTLATAAAAAPPGSLELVPQEPLLWHEQRLAWGDSETAWLPLPRLTLDSAYYADLLRLLQDLTTPLFGGVVTRWAGSPVPVGPQSAAISGAVDLAACLRDAVAIWNEGETLPFFSWAPDSSWGVRLVHLPETLLRPPLYVRLVRRDEAGRLLRMHVVAGDNYDDDDETRLARRGLVHELAHALCLWGHSEDRGHVLWRCGPIVNRPAADERRAARLWSLLPPGCALGRYGRSGELQTERHQDQGTPVEQGDGRQPTGAAQGG